MMPADLSSSLACRAVALDEGGSPVTRHIFLKIPQVVPTAGDEHDPNHYAQEKERDVGKLSQLREGHALLYLRFDCWEGGVDRLCKGRQKKVPVRSRELDCLKQSSFSQGAEGLGKLRFDLVSTYFAKYAI